MITDNIKLTKKLIIAILIAILILIVCTSVDQALSDETITNTENNNNITVNKNGDYINLNNEKYKNKSTVHMKHNDTLHTHIPTITITSKPSCGCKYYYRWYTRTWVDYCPHCHKYNVLHNAHKYPARYEQELSCKICGADYCGICGKEKYSWSKYYLRKA